MDVNDDACSLNERAALRLFASKLAPTKPGENASFNFTLVDRLAHPHIGATDA
ncbi:hypothetical protein ABIE16_005357 [Pseudomonas sp. 2725]|jgi:hypothetical protein